jgi:hypothetical protein
MDVETGLDRSKDSRSNEVVIVVDEFMSQYYNDLVQLLGSPVRRTAFFHNMALVGGEWWWMSTEHPVAQMLRANNCAPTQEFRGPCGCVEVYTDELVNRCVNDMVTLCREYSWEVV